MASSHDLCSMTTTAPRPADAQEANDHRPGVGYMPALDGLRALAVMAVVLYHGDASSLPGGFLGVEVFFVISGYLITALLIAERERTGGTAYLAFWARRARRLLPALFALVAVVATVWVVLHPDEVARLRGDIVASLGYVTNWYQIVVHQSYFEAMGRPSPLRHMWSLAVEEQFYLLWPVALAGIWRITRGRRESMAWITLALAGASTVLAVVLYHPGIDPSRVYYGTDTRASGVLLGAALAMVAPPWLMRRRVAPGAVQSLTIIGAVGLAGLVLMMLQTTEFSPFTYRGGFVVVDLLTLAVIIALVHPARTIWAKVFAFEPLLWIGRRSYGIYLWHWPVFVLTRPNADIALDGLPLLGLRLALTFAIAEVSYRFVEMPVRDGVLSRWWARRSEPDGLLPARWRRPALVGAAGFAAVALMVALATPPASTISGVDLAGVVTDDLGNLIDETTTTAPPTTVAPTTVPTTLAVAPPTTKAPTTTAPAATGRGSSTIAIGDSILLGAREAVRSALPGITVNAEVGRQFTALPSLVRSLSSAGALRSNVVIHLGTNGPPTDADLKKALDALAGVRRVVLVNTAVDRWWQDQANSSIARAAAGRSNVVVANWRAITNGRPDYFVSDGVHLTPAGAAAYAGMIASSIG